MTQKYTSRQGRLSPSWLPPRHLACNALGGSPHQGLEDGFSRMASKGFRNRS